VNAAFFSKHQDENCCDEARSVCAAARLAEDEVSLVSSTAESVVLKAPVLRGKTDMCR
jgi:hypothetical protein